MCKIGMSERHPGVEHQIEKTPQWETPWKQGWTSVFGVPKKRRRTNIYSKEIPKNSKLRTLNLDMSLFVKIELRSFRSNRRTNFSLPPSVPVPNLLPRCDCAKYAKDSKLKEQKCRLSFNFSWFHAVGRFIDRWLRRGLHAFSKSPANEGSHTKRLNFPPIMVLVNSLEIIIWHRVHLG